MASIPQIYNGKLLWGDGKLLTTCTCCCKNNEGNCCQPMIYGEHVLSVWNDPSLWAVYPAIEAEASAGGFQSNCSGDEPDLALAHGARLWLVGAFNPTTGKSIGISGSTPIKEEIAHLFSSGGSYRSDLFQSKYMGGLDKWLKGRMVKKYSGYQLLTIPAITDFSGTVKVPYTEQQAYGADFRMFYAGLVLSDEYLQWLDDYAAAVAQLYSDGYMFVAEAAPGSEPAYYAWQAARSYGQASYQEEPLVFLERGSSSYAVASGNCRMARGVMTCVYDFSYSFDDRPTCAYGTYPDGTTRAFQDAGHWANFNDIGYVCASSGSTATYSVSSVNPGPPETSCSSVTVTFGLPEQVNIDVPDAPVGAYTAPPSTPNPLSGTTGTGQAGDKTCLLFWESYVTPDTMKWTTPVLVHSVSLGVGPIDRGGSWQVVAGKDGCKATLTNIDYCAGYARPDPPSSNLLVACPACYRWGVFVAEGYSFPGDTTATNPSGGLLQLLCGASFGNPTVNPNPPKPDPDPDPFPDEPVTPPIVPNPDYPSSSSSGGSSSSSSAAYCDLNWVSYNYCGRQADGSTQDCSGWTTPMLVSSSPAAVPGAYGPTGWDITTKTNPFSGVKYCEALCAQGVLCNSTYTPPAQPASDRSCSACDRCKLYYYTSQLLVEDTSGAAAWTYPTYSSQADADCPCSDTAWTFGYTQVGTDNPCNMSPSCTGTKGVCVSYKACHASPDPANSIPSQPNTCSRIDVTIPSSSWRCNGQTTPLALDAGVYMVTYVGGAVRAGRCNLKCTDGHFHDWSCGGYDDYDTPGLTNSPWGTLFCVSSSDISVVEAVAAAGGNVGRHNVIVVSAATTYQLSWWLSENQAYQIGVCEPSAPPDFDGLRDTTSSGALFGDAGRCYPYHTFMDGSVTYSLTQCSDCSRDFSIRELDASRAISAASVPRQILSDPEEGLKHLALAQQAIAETTIATVDMVFVSNQLAAAAAYFGDYDKGLTDGVMAAYRLAARLMLPDINELIAFCLDVIAKHDTPQVLNASRSPLELKPKQAGCCGQK